MFIDPSFPGVKKRFVLPFEDDGQRTTYRWYYLPTKEIKIHNVMVDGQNYFDEPIRNNSITFIIFEKFQQVKEMIMQLVAC